MRIARKATDAKSIISSVLPPQVLYVRRFQAGVHHGIVPFLNYVVKYTAHVVVFINYVVKYKNHVVR